MLFETSGTSYKKNCTRHNERSKVWYVWKMYKGSYSLFWRSGITLKWYLYSSEMAITNFTGDVNQKTASEEFFCSAELSGGTQNQLIYCLSALNILMAIIPFLGNTLILIALHEESSLHPPSKLLFRNLAATDLCVGIIVQPVTIINWISLAKEQWNICNNTFSASVISPRILCSVSLLTSTAISVDRLLALLLGLRYRQVVTLKRSYAVTTVFWVVSIVGSLLSFWFEQLYSFYIYIGTSLCVVTSVYSYTKIFFTLRHHQHQVQNHVSQGQPNHTIPVNIARFKHTVSSVLWVQLTLVVCYLPYNIVLASTSRSTQTPVTYLERQGTLTLLYLNSSLNPILYCWKIREVRQKVKEVIRQ